MNLPLRRNMEVSDQDFFHQATLIICGSLQIDKVINDCYDYLKDFFPINGIFLNTYDSINGSIRNISKISTADGIQTILLIDISKKIRNMMLKTSDVVVIENEAEKHPIGRFFKPYIGCDAYSFLVLRLIVDGEILGVFTLFANDHDRFTQDHARLLSLLHDPLSLAMSNTLKHQEVLRLKELLDDDNRYLKREIHQLTGDEIIGANFGLKEIMEMVQQVAPLQSQVLILGETGVGKEVIANAIHYSSPRCDEAFIKVNCGAIPENLIDSELFGHEKGAFTGAFAQKRGRFERAHRGTIFLDEIGELPPPAQVRLLRVIQNREIERVGGDKPIPIDIRIIVATHRNLEEMVRDGKFREDLWFRLNVFPIVVPPLRMRKSDIPALVNYFIGKKSKELNLGHQPITATNSYKILQNYSWPGNVRELENLVERVLIKNRTAPAEMPISFDGLLPQREAIQVDTEDNAPNIENIDALPLNLDEANQFLIERALKVAKGRVQGEKGAAKSLGINPNTLRNRMKKLDIPYGRNQKE